MTLVGGENFKNVIRMPPQCLPANPKCETPKDTANAFLISSDKFSIIFDNFQSIEVLKLLRT